MPAAKAVTKKAVTKKASDAVIISAQDKEIKRLNALVKKMGKSTAGGPPTSIPVENDGEFKKGTDGLLYQSRYISNTNRGVKWYKSPDGYMKAYKAAYKRYRTYKTRSANRPTGAIPANWEKEHYVKESFKDPTFKWADDAFKK